MNKSEFKAFCKKNFEMRGFEKHKNAFYLMGRDLLCGVDLQKSNYGDVYYVNYYYFIGKYENTINYPTYCESDVEGRILVMSKTQTVRGKFFLTPMIEYTAYTEEELQPYFNRAFEEKILPPVYNGKKYIYDNLGILYTLTTNKDIVIQKLNS